MQLEATSSTIKALIVMVHLTDVVVKMERPTTRAITGNAVINNVSNTKTIQRTLI
jgi:hypothetical protein